MFRRDLLKSMGTGIALAGSSQYPVLHSETSFRPVGRRSIMDLSGAWRLRMDPTNSGVKRRWFEEEPSNAEAQVIDITVPSVWQQYLDIQGGVGWYFKDVSLPRDILGKSLRIRFGAVDYFARVWWNGKEVGTHEGGFTPFEIDVSLVARVGENRIAVRVLDVGPGIEIDGFRFDEIAAGLQDWDEGFNFGGMWQPVELILSHPLYVADAFILPKLSSASAGVHLELFNALDRGLATRVAVELKPWRDGDVSAGGNEQKINLVPGLNRLAMSVEISQAHAWSVEDPFLYRADIHLFDERQELDDTTVRFGLREFTVGPDGFFALNGKRIFLKGAQFQTTEPLTLAFPPTPDLARKIVETAKELGSNFMRFQSGAVAPSILDTADEMGILVQAEPALARRKDFSGLEAQGLRETTEMLRRDRNRPAIVIWGMVNEQAAGMRVVYKMCQVARKVDPTRLITESAGGNSHYYVPYSLEGVSYLDEHYYPGNPLSELTLRYLSSRGVPGQLYFITECGYGGLEDIDAVLEKYGPNPNKIMRDYQGFVQQKNKIEQFYNTTEAKEIFSDLAAFRDATQTLQANAVRLTFEAFRANPSCGGYNMVQLFDSNAHEVDGLVDFWRNRKKKAFFTMQEVNRPLLLVVQCLPFNPKAGQKVEVSVTLVNEEQMTGSKVLRMRAVGPSGEELFAREEPVDARAGVNRLFTGNIGVGQGEGRVSVEAELRSGDHVSLKKTEYVTVYDPNNFRWPQHGFAVFDPQQNWKGWHSRADLRIREFNADAGRPEVVVVPTIVALWERPAEFQKLLRLVDCARRGSTILFLGVPRDGPPPEGRLMGSDTAFSPLTVGSVLGFGVTAVEARGGWGKQTGPYSWGYIEGGAGSPVTRHPIFEGLPGPGLMDQEYGNMVTNQIALPLRITTETTGPTIKIIPFDNGKIVFCTLRLLENLEHDGLAEKLLSNLVGYLDRSLPTELRPQTAREQEFLRFQQLQIRDCWDKYLRSPL
jgi:beta-glucuronidase